MKTAKNLLPLIFPMFFVPSLSFAIPVKYPKCSVKLREVNGGSGAILNEDCTQAYVLPPRVSRLQISGYNETANLSFICNRLTSLESTQTNIQSVREAFSRRMKNMALEIEKREAELNDGLVPIGRTHDDMEKEIDDLIVKIADLNAKLGALDQDYVTKKSNLAQNEGGWGRFLIEIRYSELIQAYQRANPSITFVRMPIDQSFISVVDRVSGDANATELSAVLSLQVPGIGQLPLLGNSSLLLVDKDATPYTPPPGTDFFGDAISGEIRLSTLGACPLRQRSTSDFSADQISNYVTANGTYSYQVQVTRHHSISYDLQELVRQIHEQVRKSGLFSRKTFDSFIDARTTSSWITFHSESEDTRFQYTDEYIKEIKKEFIDRALAQVIAIQTGSPAGYMTLIDASGKNGADVVGDELGKCPHMYCRIGAAGFKVLSAIFGNTTTTANLTRSLSARTQETVSEKRNVIEVGTFSFK
ncbi:MAG: hypothetical protein KF799_13490 [Bdellovibrionales bacterium]|nr:hypothetical protein [Bdellovibrionales bacterium]